MKYILNTVYVILGQGVIYHKIFGLNTQRLMIKKSKWRSFILCEKLCDLSGWIK